MHDGLHHVQRDQGGDAVAHHDRLVGHALPLRMGWARQRGAMDAEPLLRLAAGAAEGRLIPTNCKAKLDHRVSGLRQQAVEVNLGSVDAGLGAAPACTDSGREQSYKKKRDSQWPRAAAPGASSGVKIGSVGYATRPRSRQRSSADPPLRLSSCRYLPPARERTRGFASPAVCRASHRGRQRSAERRRARRRGRRRSTSPQREARRQHAAQGPAGRG